MTIKKTKTRAAVLLGTGFNRWVIGNDTHVLCSWKNLIIEVCHKLKVPIPIVLENNYILQWEQIVLSMVREGYMLEGYIFNNNQKVIHTKYIKPNDVRPYQAEAHARRVATEILSTGTIGFPRHTRRSQIFYDLPVADIISLNYEAAWINYLNDSNVCEIKGDLQPENFPLNINTLEQRRLHYHLLINNQMNVWFPNGYVGNKSTKLRFGLRDYGLKSNSLLLAINEFKKWETKFKRLSEGNTDAVYSKELDELDTNQFSLPKGVATWVTPFLLRPLYILGVGLSNQEQGIWWLLNQRARNLARVQSANNSVVILLNSEMMTCEQRRFWNSEPLGIKPFWCKDWNVGWYAMSDFIREKHTS